MDTATRTKPGLVYLGASLAPETEAQRAVTFKDWEALARSGVQPQGLYLHPVQGMVWKDWVQHMRHSQWWNLPVFADPSMRDAKPFVDALCSVEKAREITEGMALRRLTLPDPEDVIGLEERLLYFLYERGPQAAFHPLLDRDSDQLYRYPAAEMLSYGHEDVPATLEALRRRGLLQGEGLVDRTRHCNSCGSAHIHFVDVCPHCQSLDIHLVPTLHCFACGNVGPETQFLTNGSLSCPKCHVNLRHIGVDYDKPLAQYLCNNCHHTSMDSMVQARCLDCGRQSQPSDLEVREVAPLRLTSNGRQAVRTGGVGESYAPLKARNYVDPQGFRRMLDWASAIQSRHPQFSFHLMRMELLHGTDQGGKAITAVRVTALLDEFAARLNALLRESDVITRMDEFSLWVLLPYTEPQGLKSRIERAMEALAKEEGDARHLGLRMQSIEVKANGGMQGSAPTAASLMQRLHAPSTGR